MEFFYLAVALVFGIAVLRMVVAYAIARLFTPVFTVYRDGQSEDLSLLYQKGVYGFRAGEARLLHSRTAVDQLPDGDDSVKERLHPTPESSTIR